MKNTMFGIEISFTQELSKRELKLLQDLILENTERFLNNYDFEYDGVAVGPIDDRPISRKIARDLTRKVK